MRTVGVVVILAVAFALSISMLIARSAVTSKIDSVKAATGTTITVSPKGFFGFNGGGTPLQESAVNKLLTLPHVASIQESLSEELSSSSTSLTSPTPTGALGQRFGGFSGFGNSSGSTTFTIPIRVIGTNSPGSALVGGANGGGTEKLTSGNTFSATASGDVAIVGQTLATKNKLVVGGSFTAWGTKIKVLGIYSSGSTFADSDVLMPLSTVQKLASASGQVTAVTITADNMNNVASVSAAITKKLGSTADVTSTESTIASELAPLNSVRTIATYTLFGSIIGAGVILLLSMLMIVRERRREVGVLKALGATDRSIVGQFIAESTTFTAMGALLGLVVGVLISSPITSALVTASGGSSNSAGGFVRAGGPGFGSGSFRIGSGGSGFTPPGGGFSPSGGGGFRFGGFHNTLTQLHTSVGWSTMLFAFAIALAIAAIGSTVASWNITRIRPAEVLRSE